MFLCKDGFLFKGFLFEIVKFSFEAADFSKFAIIIPFLNFFLFLKLLFLTFLQLIFY